VSILGETGRREAAFTADGYPIGAAVPVKGFDVRGTVDQSIEAAADSGVLDLSGRRPRRLWTSVRKLTGVTGLALSDAEATWI
jgi:hypothetical protein